jgi:hypothetical protein
MLQQAKIALKPGNKASRSRPSQPTTSPQTATVDKRALACGIIALLQHSCTSAAVSAAPTEANNSLPSLVSEALVNGMRQQPWLWERLVRHHLDYLLQTPEAVDILTTSVAQLDTQVVCRSWAVLSSRLRHVDPMVLCSAPALGNFQRAALNQVSSCFRLISRDVLPGTAGTATIKNSAVAGITTTSGTANVSEVDITLSLQLPAALYTLLYLVGVTDQQGVSSSNSDHGCVEGAAAYTAMLLTEMCSAECVFKMLQLECLRVAQTKKTKEKLTSKNDKKTNSSKKIAAKKKKEMKDGKVEANEKEEQEEEEEEEEPKLSLENVSKIYAVMHTTTVLIEAVLTSPQLANKLSTTSIENSTPAPPPSQLTRIAVLLSIRWELAQLLAAAGITPSSYLSKSFTKSAPPLWSPQTCAAIINVAVVATSRGPSSGQQQQQQQQQVGQSAPALTVPPAMLAHALELIQDALIANSSNHTEDSIEFLSQLLQRVMEVQEACATGVLNPHAAVHAGPGHHVALAAARKLHSLLLAEEASAIEKKNGQNGQNGSKRRGPAVPAASKRRKKGGSGGDGSGHDAVADLMRMFTAGVEPHQLEAGETTTTTAPLAVVATAVGVKPERKRITPQAIEGPAAVTNSKSNISLRISRIEEDEDEDEDEEEEEEDEEDELEAAPAGLGATDVDRGIGGTFGRVVMASTLDMDDATREAAWQAYIADKEKLVEMLGVRKKNPFSSSFSSKF